MLVEREVGYIWSLNIISRSRNSPSQKERLLTPFQNSRTPVTRTLKGNEKQFELQLELARVRVIGVDCKIQFAN